MQPCCRDPGRLGERYKCAGAVGGPNPAINIVFVGTINESMRVIVYTLLKRGEVYQERGAAALDESQRERIVHRLERRIAQLGYKVHLEPITAVAA